jgi:hypothetical protein
MLKVKGVERVRVSLNDGLTILDLKPGNGVTLASLRQIIKNNGFVPQEAEIVARGAVGTADGRPLFAVSGTEERLLPSANPQRSGDDWRMTVRAPK